MRWTAGGPAELFVDPAHPSIVSTPHGYLASAILDPSADEPAWALCLSTDLVNWRTPKSSEFTNLSGHAFLPIAQLAVSRGYAAEVRVEEEDYPAEWWSPDGLRWQEGIPGGVSITDRVYLAEAAECPDTAPGSGCLIGDGLLLSEVIDGATRVTYASKDGGGHWAKAKLPAHVGDVLALQRLSSGQFAAIGEVFPSAPCDGCVYSDELPGVLLMSSDGITWVANQGDVGGGGGGRILAVGSVLYALGSSGVSMSGDGGKSWTAMRDDDGLPVTGDELGRAGSHILVFHEGAAGWVIDGVGTP